MAFEIRRKSRIEERERLCFRANQVWEFFKYK